MASSPLPLPGIFAGASTSGPNLSIRPGLASHFSRLPSPTLLSGLWIVSCLWAEKCCLRTFSVFCLLSLPLLQCTLRFCNSLLVWPVRGFLSAWKFFFLHDSLLPLEQPSWSPLFFFCLFVLNNFSLSYLIPGVLACLFWRSRVFCCHLEVALFKLFCILISFLMYLWGGRQSPCFTPPPYSSAPLSFLSLGYLFYKKTFCVFLV